MRIAIVSDTHLGYARGTSRGEDAFAGFRQAVEGIIQEKPDVILHPGDLFDHKIPEQEVWDECFTLFRILQRAPSPENISITHFPREGDANAFSFQGIPVIAIAGTHEYRAKGLTNALHVLHTGNFLVCLHASHVEVEKKGPGGETEKVAIHGMPGIPEKRALEALKLYNPQPKAGMPNLLVLHQSIKEFLPSKDDMVATIGLEDLPSGFDLLVNGHLHWTSLTEWGGKRLIIPGSTVFTQMKRLEGQKEKGWYLYDTRTRELVFHRLPEQRKLYYHCLKFKDARPENILKRCREIISKDLTSHVGLLPLYRIKLKGTLAKGYSQADVDLGKVLLEFSGKALFSPAKRFNGSPFVFKVEELRALHASKRSIAQMGLGLLEQNVNQTNAKDRMDVKTLFELLEDKQNLERIVAQLEQGELIQAPDPGNAPILPSKIVEPQQRLS
ncbi:MAG: DNA repair exonuclease [Candidatus Diapherotrites archaeon]|nr:DNA repair exonuclease [Candidatus Diapherotrites archaeon]MDZ4256454.1 DNA repair exonuclease [archaeon]